MISKVSDFFKKKKLFTLNGKKQNENRAPKFGISNNYNSALKLYLFNKNSSSEGTMKSQTIYASIVIRLNIIKSNVYFTDSENCTDAEYQEFMDAIEVLTTWISTRLYV